MIYTPLYFSCGGSSKSTSVYSSAAPQDRGSDSHWKTAGVVINRVIGHIE